MLRAVVRSYGDLWRLLALLTATVLLVMGLAVDLPSAGERHEPRWAVHLEPLCRAPLGTDRFVGLVLPPGVSKRDGQRLVMEVVWQRPLVRWRLVPDLEAAEGFDAVVVLVPGDAAWNPPAGWHRVWSGGWAVLLQRDRP